MPDAVIVGSGINSLACAALLARAGWEVRVLEREDVIGGAIQTAELTEPGYLHDVFSAWHPLWVGGAAHAELGDELAARGLEYLNTPLPTATAFPDGESAFLHRTAEANVAEHGAAWGELLDSFFPNADLAFGILGTELWSRAGLSLGVKAYRRLGRRGLAAFAGDLAISSRDWLTDTFESERTHGLLAPWVLHTGLGPDAAASGYMTQVIAVAVQEGGMPIPRGGGAKLVDALVRLIRDHGGEVETGRDVEQVLVDGGVTRGVRLADGEAITASTVIANVTPTQLYGRLLDDAAVPAEIARRGRRFRFGRAEMQIHFALSEPPRWDGDERLGDTAIVHLTPGLDGVSRAVNEADRGLLPAEATVVVGQPLTHGSFACPGRRRPALDPAPGAALARQRRRRRRARHRRRHAGRKRSASATPTASRPASRSTCRTSTARSASASSSPPPTSSPRTSTSSAATPTAARWRSTRTSSGAPSRRAPGTPRRSRACGRSARARIPARASAQARGHSSLSN